MLTSFEQVRDWITDNGFKHWVLYKDRSRNEKIIDSAQFTVSDNEDKIAMTEKYLRMSGGTAFAAGAQTMGKDDLTTVAEIRLADVQQYSQLGQQQVSVGALNDQTIGELRKSIEEAMEAKWEKKMYEKERKEFEAEKKQFEADRNGVLGAIVGYLAPYIPVLNQAAGNRRNVAGTPGARPLDAEAPVHAQPIIPTEASEQQEPDEEESTVFDQFTEDEGQEIFELMARFREKEPENWLKMIRKVVAMAESGDAMYGYARNVLIQ